MAEWRWGAGKGRQHLVYLTISTGIGGGVIANGRALRGRSGNASELGHLSLDPAGWLCTCGRRGCPEAMASGTNIARRAREALAVPGVTRRCRGLGAPDSLTARDVARSPPPATPWHRGVWRMTTVRSSASSWRLASTRSIRRSSCSAGASPRPATSCSARDRAGPRGLDGADARDPDRDLAARRPALGARGGRGRPRPAQPAGGVPV